MMLVHITDLRFHILTLGKSSIMTMCSNSCKLSAKGKNRNKRSKKNDVNYLLLKKLSFYSVHTLHRRRPLQSKIKLTKNIERDYKNIESNYMYR